MSRSSAGTYPSACAVNVALRDGSTLRVRPVTVDDREAIRAFLETLSSDSQALRFFGAVSLDRAASWSVDVDYAERYAIIATTGPQQTVVAHAAYIHTVGDQAEVAFMVSDAWQGHGIATIMLAHLAAVARERGISLFTAEVMARNHRMIDVFRDSGFSVRQHLDAGVIQVELPTSLSPNVLEHFELREQTSAVAALTRFLRPRSVVVVGASRHRHNVGAELLHNLLCGGFEGSVYVVNGSAEIVQGVKAHASISDLPEPVDLAVIAVPALQVVDVARECGAAGVHGLLVISAGFAEVGESGAARQEELLATCRQAGMRLIGPNCLGVFNTAPDVRLNATFAGRSPLPGNIGFLSQSGGLGIAIIEVAKRLGLGLSTFVSVGNKADISGNDLLEYWEHDADTDVVLLYLESFGNPRRFARIARRVSASKPIVAVKSGRSPAGARATSSHTGALISASDITVDALFRQAGVIRTDTIHELFDVAALLSAQSVPSGNRVAIVTNAGGPGILCADACQAGGLDVVRLSGKLHERLAATLAPEASIANPIDMIATASADDYRRTIEALVDERAVDAIVAIFVPPLVTQADDVAREIHRAAQNAADVTLVTAFMNADGPPIELAHGAIRVPAFDFPEDAARAVARAAAYGRWLRRSPGTVPPLAGCRPDEAATIIASALATEQGWLSAGEVFQLLDCYSLPTVPTQVTRGVEEAVRAAARLRGPVALKAIAPGLIHKTDAGGVRLGLSGAKAVRAGAREIGKAVDAAGQHLDGLIVQPMAEPGVELLMGVVHDESFGPVVACGAGGISTELLGDVAVRITPLTDVDASEMLRSLRTFPLLSGYRGAQVCDITALQDVLLRLSALVDAHPEIAELDANPVLATPEGALILDARIRLRTPPPQRPAPSLRA